VDAPNETYYGGDEKGYSDWPDFAEEESGARKDSLAAFLTTRANSRSLHCASLRYHLV